MFTIIGGDGKEYGPVAVDQIREWIAAGRANLDTQAKAAGSDEWRRLGDYPEFSAARTDTPPPLVPVLPQNDLADRLFRLAAWLLDNLIAFLCCLPGILLIGVSVVTGLLMGHNELSGLDAGRLLLGIGLLAFGGLVLLVVQIWLLTTRGQTIGKRVVGIKIVRYDTGANPGFVSVVLLRWLVPGLIGAVPYLGFVFAVVDCCFIFRADRRCIHDLIAGTKVVKA
jgi:uncharacterized RDD family membrane protein YckC